MGDVCLFTRYQVTDIRKQANRMEFGSTKDEYSDSTMGKTFGMLGQEGSGKVRITKKEQKLAKKKLKAINASSGTSGLASSLAFTPVQVISVNRVNSIVFLLFCHKLFYAHTYRV